MLTAREYKNAKRRSDRYEKWSHQFRRPDGWTIIPATVKRPIRMDNKTRSQIEVYEFVHNPPDRYSLYIDRKTGRATTWMGDRLGDVEFLSPYRDNFGGSRVPIRIRGINGRLYVGTYYKSSGGYARVHLAKESRK